MNFSIYFIFILVLLKFNNINIQTKDMHALLDLIRTQYFVKQGQRVECIAGRLKVKHSNGHFYPLMRPQWVCVIELENNQRKDKKRVILTYGSWSFTAYLHESFDHENALSNSYSSSS